MGFTNKKAQMLYQDVILFVVSIVMISIILFLSVHYVSGTKQGIEKMAPTLSYKFPSVFVHSFLMMKVSKNDVIALGLNSDKTYFVKDLIWLGTDKAMAEVQNYRQAYLKMTSSLNTDGSERTFSDYKFFSGHSYDSSNLLSITTGVTDLPKLDDAIVNGNYFFYIKSQQGTYTLVYFYNTNGGTGG